MYQFQVCSKQMATALYVALLSPTKVLACQNI